MYKEVDIDTFDKFVSENKLDGIMNHCVYPPRWEYINECYTVKAAKIDSGENSFRFFIIKPIR